jgi:hypothetical protein
MIMGFLGLMLVFLVNSCKEETITTLSAYLSGILLISLALGVFIYSEKVSIQIDTKLKNLKFHKKSLFEIKNYTLKFEEIDSVQVLTIGRGHRGIVTYHLVIFLKNGKRELPGRFSLIQSEIISDAERLADTVGCKFTSDRRYNQLGGIHYILAAGGSFLIYAIWYKSTTGPFCLAMWFGTAPVVIIGFSFLALVRILRRT